MSQIQTQGTEHIPDDLIFICCKQQKISRFTVHCADQCFQFILCHEFCERGFIAAIRQYSQISKTLCTISLCVIDKGIDLLTRHFSLSLCIDTTDTAAISQC